MQTFIQFITTFKTREINGFRAAMLFLGTHPLFIVLVMLFWIVLGFIVARLEAGVKRG